MADQRPAMTPDQLLYTPFVEEIDYNEIEHIDVSRTIDHITWFPIDFHQFLNTISDGRKGRIRDCVQGEVARQLCGREIH